MQETHDNDTILEQIRQAGGDISTVRQTAAKFPFIKKALAATCRELPDNTRLPSIRKIATTLNTTVVPVQRAVTELKNDGLVYVKPKSGMYSRGKAATNFDSPIEMSGMAQFKRRIRFMTESVMPEQRALWNQIANDFQADQNYISVALDFRKSSNEKPVPPLPDVFEAAEWGLYRNYHDFSLLRLKDFLTSSPEATNTLFIGENLATIYFQSSFLFYNATELQRRGLPVPAHQHFVEQLEYCRQLKEACGNVSSIEPILLAGKLAGEMFEAIANHRSFEDCDIAEKFHRLLEFADCFSYRLSGQEQVETRFKTGRALLFLGNSNYVRQFGCLQFPFQWQAYPALNTDDCLVKVPIATAILEQTSGPMECVRWVKHLLSESAQERFCEFGYMDSRASLHDKTDCFNSNGKSLLKKFPDAAPLFAESYAQHYFSVNIVNAEIWNCLMKKQSTAEALENITVYGKAYLKTVR